jgi:hypothetical protein
MLEIRSNLNKKITNLTVFCMVVIPNISFAQKEINSQLVKSNQHDTSNVLPLSKEIEIEYRDLLISVLKKTNECLNNSLTLGMVTVCKTEEAAEMKSVKKIKQDLEKTYLKKSSVSKFN